MNFNCKYRRIKQAFLKLVNDVSNIVHE